jgi:hypothetical protein
MRTYRNASGMTKIVFDDETYFQVDWKKENLPKKF